VKDVTWNITDITLTTQPPRTKSYQRDSKGKPEAPVFTHAMNSNGGFT
jgi:hypothetical protein